ncbi:putative glycosyl [Golovinomyces cichoracearum]|uniref:Putative glycosyl n=1 Tax=Golovinomyces cichoracearum TaxID=62708 RepID=A0A420IJ53_9PEZI|nr:putative glycosyl [Golovinomyces cichoracearum]
MQKALSPEFRTKEALHNKIIIACYRPSPTVPGLIRDLRSGIEIFSKHLPTSDVLLQQNNNSVSCHDGTYLTDRRYHNEKRSDNRSFIRRNDPESKKCWICKNEGCWSGKNPKTEREEYKRKLFSKLNKTAERYISEFEGEHENIGSDNDFDMQAICEELDKTNLDNYLDSDLFLSNAGNITTEVGKGILTTLADNSMCHLINSCAEQQVDVESSTFLSRYSSEIFRGILIDSGAAAYSTASYQQYEALQKVFGSTPIIINNNSKINARLR